MKSLILVLSLFFLKTSFAGTGHGHSHKHSNGHSHNHKPAEISIEKAKAIGIEQISNLIKRKKIDKSWTKAVFDKTEKKTFSGKKEWVVTFTNEKGKKGKKIYIFLQLSGKMIAANFTGN
jgi:hypothetical protein